MTTKNTDDYNENVPNRCKDDRLEFAVTIRLVSGPD